MLLQENGQIAFFQIARVAEPQFDQVALLAGIVQLAIPGQVGDSAESDGVLGTAERQVQGFRALRMQAGPRLVALPDDEVDHLLILPLKTPPGSRVLQQCTDLFEQLRRPLDTFAGRESFAQQVPLAAQFLPGHGVLDVGRRRRLMEPANGLFQEAPERGPVDLVQRMHAEFDLLPRSRQSLDADPWFVAVLGDLVHLVQRLQIQLGGQLPAVDGVARRAELEF